MKPDQCVIQLISKNRINPIFVKANARLLEKYSDIFSEDNDCALTKLKEKWRSEYQATLDLSTDPILIFNSETAMTSFLLKWS